MVIDLDRVDLSKEIFNELANSRSEILLINSNNSEKIIILNEGNKLPIKTLEIKDERKDDGILTGNNAFLKTDLLGLLIISKDVVPNIQANKKNSSAHTAVICRRLRY